MRRRMRISRWLWLLLVTASSHAAEHPRLGSEERIVFYPGIAEPVPGKDLWRVEIQGCVFEPEKRRLMLAALREALELENVSMTPAEEKVFNERARLFLVDHERGKAIFVRVGDRAVPVGKSKADGNFSGAIDVTEDDIRAAGGSADRVTFEAALPWGERRRFTSDAFLLTQTGLSVVSDIDDTIKVTEVRDRNATLRNTFLREFRPVPGLAEFYQTLVRSNGAQFHYVSASPWQLYEPLAEFVRANGFPLGTFALKEFHWKDHSFLSLFASPEQYKPRVIEPLLKRSPQRRFVLIGDSGERDPEIYAASARKHPHQIARIYIRDVTGESESAERYARTFRGLPRELWQVFKSPEELKPFVDNAPALP